MICSTPSTSARMRPARQPASSDDLDSVHRLRTARARVSRTCSRGDARGARVLRLAGAPLRARCVGRCAAARSRPGPAGLPGAAGALRIEGFAHRHLRAGHRRLRRTLARPVARAARSAAHRPRGRIGHQHPRRPPARQRRRRLARHGRRQHPHPRRPRNGSRPRPRRAAREPGVRRGHRERRCADHRPPAHDARRRRVPRAARGAEPTADQARHGGPGHRRSRRARTHRTVLRSGETPRRRGPAGRDLRRPRRALRVRRRRHAAPRRGADDRRRHDHLRAQRPRRLRHRGGGLPRDRAQPDLPRSPVGRAPARGLLLRRPADDRHARPRGVEGHGDLVELPGPDAHPHHLDEHPSHGALPPAPP